MLKTITKLLAASALFAASALAVAALPSTKDVEAAMRAQNWQQAETMLLEVTNAKPTNAKAWYLLAQAEEKQGKFGSAQQDLLRAEKLDPSLSFASPGQVPALEQRLAGEIRTQAPAHAPSAQTQSISHVQPAPQDSGLGWVWALLGFAFIALMIYWVWRMFTGPSRTVGYGGYGGGVAGVAGVGGSTVVVNNNSGSNLLSTMILADAIRDGHHHEHYRDDSYSSSSPAQQSSDWDSGSSSSSPVDLGGSSGSWDSGTSSSSSSYDSGSSSSDSDW